MADSCRPRLVQATTAGLSTILAMQLSCFCDIREIASGCKGCPVSSCVARALQPTCLCADQMAVRGASVDMDKRRPQFEPGRSSSAQHPQATQLSSRVTLVLGYRALASAKGIAARLLQSIGLDTSDVVRWDTTGLLPAGKAHASNDTALKYSGRSDLLKLVVTQLCGC